MLSNTGVQYLVSRVDLKEMASTTKQNNKTTTKKSRREAEDGAQVGYIVIITALLFHKADFLSEVDINDKDIVYLRIFYIYTYVYVSAWVCACMHAFPLWKGDVKV